MERRFEGCVMCDLGALEQVDIARHSMSHILAAAVKELCPDVKLGIGPSIENGFYYDFLLPEGFTFSPEVVERIVTKMKELLKNDYTFTKTLISFDEAKKRFVAEPFKLELISDLQKSGEENVSIYTSGEFTDLCTGPHVASTKELRSLAWQVDRVSGAYWKGSEKNPMLQRIYVLAFPTKDELKDFIARREEAMQRDHRKLGSELDLFIFSDLIGKGLPLFTAKGATIRRVLERFIVDEELRRGYQHVCTPPLAKRELYEVSGHWQHYKDGMYPPMDLGDDQEIVLRPMTCPHHFELYNSHPRSYRDLPMRIAEIASQFRRELSGELTGLARVMMFTLADAHIVCRKDQLEEEFEGAVDLIRFAMTKLGLDSAISFRASLRDKASDKYVDNDEMWEKGEAVLTGIMDKMEMAYTKSPGDAAFYGPKLDVQMRNVLGKEETIFTVQIDFCLPERFDMTYIDEKGEKARPVVIHRSSIGCLERTIAFLLEFYGGSLPLWLSPVQVKTLTITDAQLEFGKKVDEALRQAGVRTELDVRNEKIGKKLREARLQRIPYLLILGEKEAADGVVTVRNRDTGEQQTVTISDFVKSVVEEDRTKALKLGG